MRGELALHEGDSPFRPARAPVTPAMHNVRAIKGQRRMTELSITGADKVRAAQAAGIDIVVWDLGGPACRPASAKGWRGKPPPWPQARSRGRRG